MSGTQSKKSANFHRSRHEVRRHGIASAFSRLQAGQPREIAATGIERIREFHTTIHHVEAHRVARELLSASKVASCMRALSVSPVRNAPAETRESRLESNMLVLEGLVDRRDPARDASMNVLS
jgi:hypothetical protein